MSKRKADGTTVVKVGAIAAEVGISWPKSAASSTRLPTLTEAVGQVSSIEVSTSHLGPVPATSEVEGVRSNPERAPAGTTEPVPGQVEVVENAAAEAFWELLQVAGYTIWG